MSDSTGVSDREGGGCWGRNVGKMCEMDIRVYGCERVYGYGYTGGVWRRVGCEWSIWTLT